MNSVTSNFYKKYNEHIPALQDSPFVLVDIIEMLKIFEKRLIRLEHDLLKLQRNKE